MQVQSLRSSCCNLQTNFNLIILNSITTLITLGAFSFLATHILSKHAEDTVEMVAAFLSRDNDIWQWLNQTFLGNLETLSAELEDK